MEEAQAAEQKVVKDEVGLSALVVWLSLFPKQGGPREASVQLHRCLNPTGRPAAKHGAVNLAKVHGAKLEERHVQHLELLEVEAVCLLTLQFLEPISLAKLAGA